jgi:hypothetical protein
MAITAQEKENLDYSRVDNEGLQNLKSSAEAYEKVLQAAMRIESNTPERQAKYEVHLAEVSEHKAALNAEIQSRLTPEQKYEQFMQRTMDRVEAEQVAQRAWRDEHRPAFEAAARDGAWAPDWAKRDLKPAPDMTNKEIVLEARDLHSQFQQLKEKYEQAPANQKAEIREEMAPVVNRENELRQEYTERVGADMKPEIKLDRVPQTQISYSY